MVTERAAGLHPFLRDSQAMRLQALKNMPFAEHACRQQPSSERTVAGVAWRKENAKILFCTHFTRSPSVTFGASSLPEGAYDSQITQAEIA